MRAGNGQVLIDVAIEQGGQAESVWDMAVHNGLSPTDTVVGIDIAVPSVPNDHDVVASLEAAKVRPASDESINRSSGVPIGQAVIGTDIVN